MKYQFVISMLAVLGLAHASTVLGQTDEIKFDAAQPKITTVSAMRARKAPQATAEEIMRLKLGTVVSAIARSSNQDTISGKSDYWYRVNLPNGETGWLFGGLLLDYDVREREQLLRRIIEARLKAENTDFSDRLEIYNLAASSLSELKDPNARAEFELLKLLALANAAGAFPDNLKDKSPYREWLKAHGAEVVHNEFAGGYNLRSELLWNLEAKYHTLPISERMAWEAAENMEPSDCESDEVCDFFRTTPEIKYLNLHPNGAHAAEALKNLRDALTDDVIGVANSNGGDQYQAEARIALRKELASLRAALAKTSASEKTELLKKLARITAR
jgi:hypothetical protein